MSLSINYSSEAFLKSINIYSRGQWENYEKSLSYLLKSTEHKKLLVVFDLALKIIVNYSTDRINKSENEQTIKQINARIFNTMIAAFYLCTYGYYQASLSHVRDLIEIHFLLDYFSCDSELIAKWTNATNQERKTNFSAAKIYDLLDKRDGYKDKRRKELYQKYCEYAVHVSFPGITTLLKDAEGSTTMGYFYDEDKLYHTMYDFIRISGITIYSSIVLIPTPIKALQLLADYMEKYSDVFGLGYNDKIQEYKKVLSKELSKSRR